MILAVYQTTIISPLEAMMGPLLYRTSTTNIIMISPSIFIHVWLMIIMTHVGRIVPVEALVGGAFLALVS